MVRFNGGNALTRWVTLMMVAVTLSGCTDTSPTDAPLQGSGIKQSVQEGSIDSDDLAKKGLGVVVGHVINDIGFNQSGVQVTILSVADSQFTDDDGWFRFDEVPEGSQVLRAEKQGLQTLVREIEVVAGKVTELEVVLYPAGQVDASRREHKHTAPWGADGTLTITDQTFDWPTTPTDVCNRYGLVGLTYSPDCGALDLTLQKGEIVPPGTSHLLVDVGFTPGANFDNEVFSISGSSPVVRNVTTGYNEARGFVHTLEASEQLRWDILPLQTDHGHAQYSEFAFRVLWTHDPSTIIVGSALPMGGLYSDQFRSPITLKLTAVRGPDQVDRPHPLWWAESDLVEIEDTNIYHSGCTIAPTYDYLGSLGLGCYSRKPDPKWNGGGCGFGCFFLPEGNIVPPGTTRLEFGLQHYYTQQWMLLGVSPQAVKDVVYDGMHSGRDEVMWRVGWKGADKPYGGNTMDDYVWVDPGDSFAPEDPDALGWVGRRYTIDVPTESVDNFYSTHSSWVFQISAPGSEDAGYTGDPTCSDQLCGATRFQMVDIVAYNDNTAETVEP